MGVGGDLQMGSSWSGGRENEGRLTVSTPGSRLMMAAVPLHNASFHTLPNEMLPSLFAMLDGYSLAALAGTCFQLSELCSCPEVWGVQVRGLLHSSAPGDTRGWDLAFQDDRA